MKKTIFAVTAILFSCSMAAEADAAAVISFNQSGSDVIIDFNGSLNLTGSERDATPWTSAAVAGVDGQLSKFAIGERLAPQGLYTPLFGEVMLGQAGFFSTTDTTGDAIYFDPGRLFLPADYVSGAALKATMRIANISLSALQMSTESSVLRLSSGDTITISGVVPVPEPTTWGMMLAGFGLVGIGMRSRRRKDVVTA